MAAQAGRLVDEAVERSERLRRLSVQGQREAARLRLIEELGRILICFEPDLEDLNGKLYRLMSEHTATADRLKLAYSRLGGYPEWEPFQIQQLRAFRATLPVNQVRARLTGRELDAALADPRWQVLEKEPFA